MKAEYELGSIAGLRISVQSSFFIARFLAVVVLAIVGRSAFKLSRREALFGAISAVVLDAFAVLFHQLGHARIAKSTGWPMTGIRFWGLFSTCTYPLNEPELPPMVHIRRAVGGPFASLLLGLFTGLPALWLLPKKGLGRLLALFWLINNVAVKFVLAFGPLSWTDGPPMWRWGRRLLAERGKFRPGQIAEGR
jgi:hypothetical protein